MIKDLLREGFILKNSGHYKHAIEVFYKALEHDSTSSELLLEIADLYFKMHNEEKALNYIEQILQKIPNHVETLRLLERIFVSKNAIPQAEQVAKNIYCISQEPGDLLQILKYLNLQAKYDEIFEYKVENPNVFILMEQAKAFYQKKELEKSQLLLEQALEKEPQNQDLLLLIGQVYYAQNKKDECIQILSKLSNNSTNPELLSFYGLIEAHQGNYKSAIKSINEAIKLAPNNDEYYFNLANIYYKQGDTLYAKRYYNLAISLNPENKNYHFALANLYYSEKHYKRALEELRDDFFEANLLKMIILYETGYLALARKELDLLLEKNQNNEILKDYKVKIDNELGLN